MHSPLKIKLTDLNPHLTCILCNGYFINATTITECLHSFCRSCIVKYLETNKYCPICEVQIHKTKPLLNLRSDQTLQDIVYKLVPGLFQNEMQRRKTFYASNPTVSKPVDPELSGELPERSYIYTSEDYISLSLEYYNNNNNNINESTQNQQLRRYLRCPAAVSISHLQKLIRAKYGLTKDHQVDILYQNETLCEEFTLIDVAYIYLWKRKCPLHLKYRIFETECRKKSKLSNDYHNNDSLILETIADKKREETEEHRKDTDVADKKETFLGKSDEKEEANQTDDKISDTTNLNKNTISDKIIVSEEVVLCQPTPPDKEVHLQISESGIISVTSIATSPELTQTVPPQTSSSTLSPSSSSVAQLTASSLPIAIVTATITNATVSVPPVNASAAHPVITTTSVNVSNLQTTVILPSPVSPSLPANIVRVTTASSKKSDLKSVRKQNKTTPTPPSPPVPTKSLTIPPTTVVVTTSNCGTTNNTVQLQDESQNDRKRKLSQDSIEQQQNKKCVSDKVPSSSIASISKSVESSSITTVVTSLLRPVQSSMPTLLNNHPMTVTTSSRKLDGPITTPQIQKSSGKSIPPLISSSPPVGVAALQSCVQKITTPQTATPKKTQIRTIGYKTLRDPPKTWNPTLPPRTHNHLSSFSNSDIINQDTKLQNTIASSSNTTLVVSMANVNQSNSVPSTVKPKQNKFFKVRNNMPRYLGNPASGVKPMYQISTPIQPQTSTASTIKTTKANSTSVVSNIKITQNISKTTTSIATDSLANKNNLIDSRDTISDQHSQLTKNKNDLIAINDKVDQFESNKQSDSIKKSSELVDSSKQSLETNKLESNQSISFESVKPVDVNQILEMNDKQNSPNNLLNNNNNNNTVLKIENNQKLKTTSTSTSNSEKLFQTSRNNLKSLSTRSSPMTVSEMLQLRNSKTNSTNPTSSQELGKEKDEKTLKKINFENDKAKEDDVEINKSKTDLEKVSTELKISQTTVPIYSPRLKQKNDTKFQKNINSNLRIDVHNTEVILDKSSISSKLFSPQTSSSLLLDRSSPKLPIKNVPSSPKLDHINSAKIIASQSSPKSPKNITKVNSQVSPMFDPASGKPQLSPQLDRMSPKRQIYKISPTHQQSSPIVIKTAPNFDRVSPKNLPKSGTETKLCSTSTCSKSKSPTVGKACSQLSPKTQAKNDVNNASQIPSQKFNFMPPNPFIPNLSSPNLSPNQFLFSNYAINAAMSSYDPRFNSLSGSMNSLASAYHNLPISLTAMLYNQYGLAYSGTPQSVVPPSTVTSSCPTLVHCDSSNSVATSIVSTTSSLAPTTSVTAASCLPASSADSKQYFDSAKSKSKDKNAATSANKK